MADSIPVSLADLIREGARLLFGRARLVESWWVRRCCLVIIHDIEKRAEWKPDYMPAHDTISAVCDLMEYDRHGLVGLCVTYEREILWLTAKLDDADAKMRKSGMFLMPKQPLSSWSVPAPPAEPEREPARQQEAANLNDPIGFVLK